MALYLSDPKDWERLATYCSTQTDLGVDTEYVDLEDGTKQVVVWSISAFLDKESPFGYRLAAGVVLPAEALPLFKDVLTNRKICKWAHNAPADARSIWDTAGIVVSPLMCTLQWLRLARPGRDDYGLKPASMWVLGKPARPGFKEVTTEEYVSIEVKKTKQRWCVCGTKGCKKRLGHTRHLTRRFTPHKEVKQRRLDPRDITPDHPKADAWHKYALVDAVDALELSSWLRQAKDLRPGDPWSRAEAREGQLEKTGFTASGP